MSETVEQEIVRKGLTAPRVTNERIDEVIVAEMFYRYPGTTVTVCCLSLLNGFTVIGEAACASPENFDEALGQRIARENARGKIWALEGYALRERLMLEAATAPSTPKARATVERDQLRDRLIALDRFGMSPAFNVLPSVQRSRLVQQAMHMREYLNVLNARLEDWGS